MGRQQDSRFVKNKEPDISTQSSDCYDTERKREILREENQQQQQKVQ